MRCLAAAAAYGSSGPSGAAPGGGAVRCATGRSAGPPPPVRRSSRLRSTRPTTQCPPRPPTWSASSAAQGGGQRRNRARRGRPARVDGAPHAANAVGAVADPTVPLSAAVPPAPILSIYAAAPMHAAWLVALRAMAASRPRRQAGRPKTCPTPAGSVRARPPCPGCCRRHARVALRACRAIMLRGRAGRYVASTARKWTMPAGQAKDVTRRSGCARVPNPRA